MASERQTTENEDSKSLQIHCLTLADNLHSHKLSRTATWYAPKWLNRQVHNHRMIDFILIPKRFKLGCQDVYTVTILAILPILVVKELNHFIYSVYMIQKIIFKLQFDTIHNLTGFVIAEKTTWCLILLSSESIRM